MPLFDLSLEEDVLLLDQAESNLWVPTSGYICGCCIPIILEDKVSKFGMLAYDPITVFYHIYGADEGLHVLLKCYTISLICDIETPHGVVHHFGGALANNYIGHFNLVFFVLISTLQ
eukprot:7013114-Ditylum_brightwellii.AAC.1